MADLEDMANTADTAGMTAFRAAVTAWAAGGPDAPAHEPTAHEPTARELAAQLAAQLPVHTAVLLEGPSDAAAVDDLAEAHGRDLGPGVTFPSAGRRHARTLAAPGADPSTSSTRAYARHTESTHLTPPGPASGRTTGM
ncbi:hypothetical protein OK074_4370 [Actinobacteria bacterium OK074]|nr:hypothetical protein OK074_4370 [Actinobacteria bacterium OK074]